MKILNFSQLVSISQLQRNYSSLVAKIKKMSQPIILLRRNKPEAVLISVNDYQDLLEKKRYYEEKLALEAIALFEKDKKAGTLLKGKKGSDLLQMEKKLT